MNPSEWKLAVLAWALLAAAPALADNVAVTTQHNNNARTGVNLQETILNTTVVNSGTFGKRWTYVLQTGERVGGQPLYLPGVSIPGKGVRNVVYIGTSFNNVMAVDAETGEELWKAELNSRMSYSYGTGHVEYQSVPVPNSEIHLEAVWLYGSDSCNPDKTPPKCNDSPFIGILSTPVIDTSTNKMYLVSKHRRVDFGPTATTVGYTFYLHALDVTTGAETLGGPKEINGTAAGHHGDSAATTWTFDARWQNQRPGLLLSNSRVYVGFGSWEDSDTYHGWLFSYPASDLSFQVTPVVFCTTPHGWGFLNDPGDEPAKGGIWMAGAGLVADSSNNVYAMTGNGPGNSTAQRLGPNVGNSFVKWDTDLGLSGFLYDSVGVEPTNEFEDGDLGSSGPILLGDHLLGAGKPGRLHVVSTSTMTDSQSIIQLSSPPWPYVRDHLHGSPVFLPSNAQGTQGTVYFWAEQSNLLGYTWNGTSLATSALTSHGPQAPYDAASYLWPTQGLPVAGSMPGGTLSGSANGIASGTGILWATIPTSDDALHANVLGTVRAFDANNLANQIWNSDILSSRDSSGILSKGANPTISNGKVFIGGMNALTAYGILPVVTQNAVFLPLQ